MCGTVETGTLEGHVYDQNNNPVEGANVTAQPATLGNGINATTDPNGFYTMNLVVGTYDVTASKTNYTSQQVALASLLQRVRLQFRISRSAFWEVGHKLHSLSGALIGIVMMASTLPELDWHTSWVVDLGLNTNGWIYSFNPQSQTCADTTVDMPVPISNYTIVPLNVGGVDWLCSFGGRNDRGCYDPHGTML